MEEPKHGYVIDRFLWALLLGLLVGWGAYHALHSIDLMRSIG